MLLFAAYYSVGIIDQYKIKCYIIRFYESIIFRKSWDPRICEWALLGLPELPREGLFWCPNGL